MGRLTRISTLAAGLAVISAGVLLPGTGSAGPAPAAESKNPTGGPAAQALERAAAVARNRLPEDWLHPVFQDSMLDGLAAARSLVLVAHGEEDDDEANAAYESAAWTLDVLIRRSDGEAGESESAYMDDWLGDPGAVTELHGVLVQARSEVLRQRR